jgi:uncharacterized protein YqgC (DUF456 family)
MRTHTDSEIITYNEDGSWTTKSEITTYPATKGQQAAAIGTLIGVCLLPVVPLVYLTVVEKLAARSEARKAKKNLTTVKD